MAQRGKSWLHRLLITAYGLTLFWVLLPYCGSIGYRIECCLFLWPEQLNRTFEVNYWQTLWGMSGDFVAGIYEGSYLGWEAIALVRLALIVASQGIGLATKLRLPIPGAFLITVLYVLAAFIGSLAFSIDIWFIICLVCGWGCASYFSGCRRNRDAQSRHSDH